MIFKYQPPLHLTEITSTSPKRSNRLNIPVPVNIGLPICSKGSSISKNLLGIALVFPMLISTIFSLVICQDQLSLSCQSSLALDSDQSKKSFKNWSGSLGLIFSLLVKFFSFLFVSCYFISPCRLEFLLSVSIVTICIRFPNFSLSA